MDAKSAWQAVAGKSERAEAAFRELDAAYSSPERAYHSWQHILECLGHLAMWAAAHGTPDPAITLAIFYHDAIYEPGAGDNEERSSELAVKRLRTLDVAPGLAEHVRDLVLATKHTAPAPPSSPLGDDHERNCDLVIDTDLAILGADPERFREYDEQVRREYRSMPADAFTRARARILGGFLAGDRIYRTAFFHDRLEAQARTNLSQILDDVYAR